MSPRIRVNRAKALAAMQRLEREIPGALSRATRTLATVLGRRIAENVEGFKQFQPGTRRLARSFLVPVEGGLGRFILGLGAPVYAAIHEYGGVIRATNKPYLVFQYPPGSGEWHSVKQVTIREKRYARDAVDEVAPRAAGIVEAVLIPLLRDRA